MTIQEAIKSGKKFRLTEKWSWMVSRDNHWICKGGITIEDHQFRPDDILATDWEVLICEDHQETRDVFEESAQVCCQCREEEQQPEPEQDFRSASQPWEYIIQPGVHASILEIAETTEPGILLSTCIEDELQNQVAEASTATCNCSMPDLLARGCSCGGV